MPESPNEKLSVEDARSLHYYHHEKGDMSYSVHWGRLKPIVRRDFPEVLAAREQVRVAQRTLDAVVDKMLDQVGADE